MESKVQRQREHFDRISETYRRSRKHENHLTLKTLMWRDFLQDKAYLKGRRLRVLEPMCGFADGKAILEQHLGVEIDYVGFDFSDQVVAKLSESDPRLHVFHADITRFRPPPEDFDLIILLGGLHHVPDYAQAVVENMAAGLRPGGTFINLEPTHGNPVFRAIREGIYRRNEIFDEATERGFRYRELMEMFERVPLTLVDRSFPGFLSYVLYYNPDAFPRINLGGPKMVRTTFAFDKLFMRGSLGSFLSFATLTMWRKT